jgi:hypothetical protein
MYRGHQNRNPNKYTTRLVALHLQYSRHQIQRLPQTRRMAGWLLHVS